MEKNVLKTGSAVLMLLLFSLCVMAQDGSKNVTTQTRNVATFDGLNVSGIFKVIFTQGEPQSVKIETDDNLMDKVVTEVHNGVLEISTKGNHINNPTRMVAYITAKTLTSLKMSGVSKLTATNKLVAPKLKIDLSGASNVTLSANISNVNCNLSGTAKFDIEGSGDQLTADLSGTAKLTASKFEIKDAKVDASGVGSASINATKSVSLDASGVSKINYTPHDNLNIKNINVSGLAHVTH